ncbi:hypothetical protein BOX15_Mlig002288g1 [Macrostomum lignano]|uniref:Uncharacterized protein n=2 Tax=Macrostomum lignano TaxID=282301 RepID=A0A267FJF0_9PLAT|nr:hypothetical protein BOX15_Mlig002288g1 [Macrostomum lignano]
MSSAASRAPTAPLQRYLRWIQVTLYVGSGIFSLISCVTLKVTFDDLRDTCPLYARPAKVELAPSENGSYVLRLDGDLKGGEKKTCYYSMYLNITTASYSLLWGALFALLSSPNKARKGHLRRLVFPSLLFNSVLFTSQLISSCVLTLGHRFWCSSIINDLEDSEHVKELMRRSQFGLTCPLIQSFPWRSTHPDFAYFRSSKFFGLITIAQISSWMVSLTLLILSIICGERFFKAVWFGEFEGSQDSLQPQPQPQQRRSKFAPKATEAAAAAPGSSAASTGQLRNGMVRENPNAASASAAAAAEMQAGHRKALALVSCPGTAAAAVAMAEQQQQQQPDCLPGDTLMANRSALAGYERSLAARQRSAGGQSGRSLGGGSGGLSSSLASSATPLLALETPQSPQLPPGVAGAAPLMSPNEDAVQETQLWEPRVQQHHHLRQQSHPPNNSLTMRQHGGGRSRDCNLYSAWRTQY